MDAEKIYSVDEIDALWPQAAAELAQFAKVLDARGHELTAAQLRMAVQMANKYQECSNELHRVAAIYFPWTAVKRRDGATVANSATVRGGDA